MMIEVKQGGEFVFTSTISHDGEDVLAEVTAEIDCDNDGSGWKTYYTILKVVVDGREVKHCLDIHQVHDLENDAAYWMHREQYDQYLSKARDRYESSL